MNRVRGDHRRSAPRFRTGLRPKWFILRALLVTSMWISKDETNYSRAPPRRANVCLIIDPCCSPPRRVDDRWSPDISALPSQEGGGEGRRVLWIFEYRKDSLLPIVTCNMCAKMSVLQGRHIGRISSVQIIFNERIITIPSDCESRIIHKSKFFRTWD